MSNVLRRIQRNQDGSPTAIPGRTFERTQGCYNCVSFESGERAKLYWINTCRPRDLATANALDVAGKTSAAGEVRATIKAADAAIKAGVAGLCLAGKAKSDFVVHNFLCESWTARQGASVARAGGKADLLPDEMKDIVDGSDG